MTFPYLAPRRRRRASLSIEALEGRTLLSTFQNFDTQGTPYAYPGPVPPPVIAGGPTGDFLRLESVEPIPASSITFARTDPGLFARILASFDFRISPTVQPGDGLGFALLNTGAYGNQGSVTAPGGNEQLPNFTASLGIGFAFSNDTTSATIHYNSVQIGAFPINPASIDLASDQFITAQVAVEFTANSSTVSLFLQPSIGFAVSVFENFAVPGMAPYESRVHIGARSADQADFDIDNVNVQFQTQILPSVYALEPVGLTIPENAGPARFRISRTGSTFGASSVQYATIDAGARAGVDYVSVSGTVTFAAGEVEKELLVPLIDNNTVDKPSRDFQLIIVDPAVTTSHFRSAAVSILDNDDPGIPPTVAPRVGLLRSRARRPVEGFILSFSTDLNPGHAQNPASYTVQSVIGHRRVRYRSIPIASATYDVETRTVTLRRVNNTQIRWPIRITVNGTTSLAILGLNGLVLDGNRDGQPGGDAILTVRH